MMDLQDEVLDGISGGLERIHGQALAIGAELEAQNKFVFVGSFHLFYF